MPPAVVAHKNVAGILDGGRNVIEQKVARDAASDAAEKGHDE